MRSTLVRTLLLFLFPVILLAQTPDSTRHDSTSVRVTSRVRITGARLDSLPIDDPASAFAHIPGVFLRGGDVGIQPNAGFSIRGGAVNGAATFIDGAPVRSQLMIGPFITPALNGIGSIDVTTGLAGIELSDGQGGVVSYQTPSGGDHLVTHWTAHTDEPFSSPVSVGYNRFSGLVSGPVPGMQGLTFFASGMVQGQSSEYLGAGAQDVPTYVVGGLDTTLQIPNGSGGGTTSFAVPRFIQSSGTCDAATNSAACRGIFRPMDWRTQIQLQGKVRWSYGRGSVSLTGLATGNQSRQFPGVLLNDPLLFTGEHDWSRLAVVNWHHTLNDALSFEAVMSWGTNRFIQGALDPASEADTRDPSLGIELSTLGVPSVGGFDLPISDQIIRNIRTSSGLRVPYQGQTQFSNVQIGRLNPYAVFGAGFVAGGADAPLSLGSERQLTGRWQATWRKAAHAVTAGVDAGASELSSYSTASLISETGLDAWTASPRRFGIFAADEFRVGDVLIDAGLRYDHVNPGGELTTTPGFVSSDPSWNALAATSDTAYAGSVARVFQRTRGQGFVTPRVRVSGLLGPTTAVSVSAGEQLEMPPAFAIFSNANGDLTFTNGSSPFGRDVGYSASRMIELDVHQALPSRAALDLAAYYRGHIPAYGYFDESFDDPTNCSTVNGVRTCRQLTLNVLDQAGTSHVWGLEVSAREQVTDQVLLTESYSLLGSGGDAGIDLSSNAQAISGVTGTVLPASGGAGASGTAEHAIALGVDAAVPDGWAAGGWKSALQHVALIAQFRLISGEPYTPLVNQGNGEIAPSQNFAPTAVLGGDINSASLPWTKYLDLRLTKGVRANGLDWTLFADFRNLLNSRNVNSLFAETNDVTNPLFESAVLGGQFPNLANEAANNGAYVPSDGSIVTVNCGTWTGSSGPIDCVMLSRAEARFGNGDGKFTQTEQTKAFDAFYQSLYGAWRFLGPQRTIRVGLELAF